jgi:hypothetical protein
LNISSQILLFGGKIFTFLVNLISKVGLSNVWSAFILGILFVLCLILLLKLGKNLKTWILIILIVILAYLIVGGVVRI